MKNKILNQLFSSCKKWKTLVLISLLLTLGVGQMWGVNYYFRHWDANNSTQLVDRGSSIYSSYFILSGNISFKISDADWTNANTFGKSSSAISLNSEYSCASTGSDFSLNFSTNRAYLVRLNASASTKKLLISTFVPDAAAPSAVVSGTNAMFYIQGYEGLNYLVNSSKTQASTSTPMNYTGISYVNTAKSNLSTYDRISNNPGGWNGDENANIKSAAGGELFNRDGSKTAAKTASTTASVSGSTLSISTTTNATTGVYGSLPLYIQYYIDDTFVGVTYNSSTASYGSIPAGGATARASTYNISSLSDGTHTLKTILTDGIIFWVADTDEFAISSATATLTYHANWYTTGTSGSVPTAQTVAVGANATVAGNGTLAMTNYTFAGWNTAEYITGTDYAAGNSITMDTNKDLYAKWTRSITLNQNGATTNGTTSVTGTYNCATLPSIINPSKTGYDFGGWNTENDGSGNLVINTSGVLQSNVYHWTDQTTPSNRFQRNPSSTSPLYALWTQTVTLKANTANHGSGSDGSATIILNATEKSSITHCTPASGYKLDGYYTDATGGTKILNADGSFAATNISDYITSSKWTKAGATTLYAQYEPLPKVYLKNTMNWENAYVTFYKAEYWDASNGAGSSTASANYAAGPVAMTYNSATGLFEYQCPDNYTYTYACFTKDQQNNYGNFWDTEAIYCNNNLQYNKVIVVARETNTMYNSDHTKYYTDKTNGNIEFVALASGEGTGWFFPGDWSSWEPKNNEGAWNSTNVRWTKSLLANTTYEFKVYNHGVYYGNSGTYEATGSKTFTNGGDNCKLKTTLAGTYTFDYNTSTNSLTISYPAVYAVSGSFNSWTEETNLSFSGNDGTYSVTIDGSGTNYEFKVLDNAIWYGHSNKTFTATESNVSLASNSNNIKLKADIYPSGSYTFSYNKSTHKLGVTYPTSYTVTFGKRTGGNTATAKINNTTAFNTGTKIASGTSVTFAQTAISGYTFEGWYNQSSGGTKVSSSSSYTTTISAATTLYANYTANQYTVTLNKQSSAEGHGTDGTCGNQTVTYNAVPATITPSTLPTAANGYAFMGFYTAVSGGGSQIILPDGTWAANVTGYTGAGGKWTKVGGVTLYAYYKKAEVTGITLDPVAVGTDITVTATATIDPTPTGSTIVCWRLLHDNESPIETTFTPVTNTPASQTSVSFTSPSTSAWYRIEAKLRTGSACGGGTELNTYTYRFQVAGTHTVTVNYTCGSDEIKTSTSVTANPIDWSDDITAPDIFGYTFARWDAGTGVTIKDGTGEDLTTSTSATIKIKASYNGSLTAVYTQKNIVYFKDNLGWTDPDDADAHIYVNLLTSDYWDTNNGSGNNSRSNRNLEMSRVPGASDIFYYEYGNKTTSNYISFTKESMDNYNSFYQAAPNVAHVVFPSRSLDALGTDKATGLGFYAKTPMFVPLATQTPAMKNSNRAEYYNDGYWTKFTPGTGYSLDIYQSNGSTHVKIVEFTSADDLMPMKVVTELEGNHTYKFQLKRDGDVYYGNSGTMTYTDHGQNTPWEFNNSPFSMCTIVTNAAGDYTFNLSFSPNNGGTNNRLRIEVDYPVATGDYRLIYDDAVQTNYKSSFIIPKKNSSTAIVSFFVRKNSTPDLRIQQATVANDGTITWNEYPTSGTPTNQMTDAIKAMIESTPGVYNFNLSMNESGALSVTSAEKYTGNFYIRTDCANSKWDNYRTDPDHLMTYSEYSITHGGYSHYYAHWVDASVAGRKNVKFCIANDYSPSISDTLACETASDEWANIANYITEGGDLKRNANVRFMWNQADNTIKRAYIDGAQDDIHSFLELLSADHKITDAGGTELTEVSFSDNENWIYEANIKAQPNAAIKLKSTWGESSVIEQYFVGTSSTTEKLIGGSGEDWYSIRLIYDFKTNRLVAAYLPSGDLSGEIDIDADVMFIREAQGDIAQLTFSEGGTVKDIKTAYGVMKFSKWTLNNKSKESGHSPLSPQLSPHQRGNFYISFPFRVKLSEVFGFGTYGTHWVIQYYDGQRRADEGFWAESSGFWTFVWDRKDFYLEPNVGYLLLLDLDLFKESSGVWGPESRSDQVELFFPSYGDMPDLTGADVVVNVPAHECKIDRSKDASGNPTGLPDTGNPSTSYNRKVFDSHWNIMGVPTYVNTDDVTFASTTWTATKPDFLYTWNMEDNTLSARSGSSFEYHAMHSYIVQYYGDVTWSAKSGSAYSSPVAARRTYMDKPQEVEFRLEVQQNDKMVDQTFVKLSDDEEVSAGFSFDEDMTKIFNSRNANIYTFVENMTVAGNTMPMDFEKTTIIPVGAEIKAAGEFTFSIPDGTEGIGVTLIDNVRGTRTNLALGDYIVELEAGTYNDRFVLEISPIMNTPTDVEGVTGDGVHATGVRKVMVDGILYIVKDGKVFDARGSRVK